ncbi:MAG: hypothetical protein M1833_000836 [Piccolia ochrophora]|nr:MAG: hypothetical protein M1833_000836 [Piccolia ochrophora]
MVSIVKRMTKLRSLLAIRLGPGAAVLSPEVQRIHMQFAVKTNDGHTGPRLFWRRHLPRLKYHNPAIPMTVNRGTDQSGPALMTVSFAPASPSSSPTASPAPTSSTADPQLSTTAPTPSADVTPASRVETIDMKHRSSDDILAELMDMTRGMPVVATLEEEQQLADLKVQAERAELDRQRTKKIVAARKNREEVLRQARGDTEEVQAA